MSRRIWEAVRSPRGPNKLPPKAFNMKRLNLLQLVIVALLLVMSVTGCKKTPKGVTTIPGSRSDVTDGVNPAPPINAGRNTAGPGNSGVLPRDPNLNQNPVPAFDPNKANELTPGDRETIENMLADRAALAAETIYFDFDQSNIRASEKGKLEAVASYLKNQPTHKVQIEGHCDERGTEEYNRSLGERRALAAREYLMSLGIAGDRVFTISFGEDKPADTGHDDAAWAKNRRGEFIALKPK
jgi:peptidoglycan-associated lipoprotein